MATILQDLMHLDFSQRISKLKTWMLEFLHAPPTVTHLHPHQQGRSYDQILYTFRISDSKANIH